MPIKVCLSIMFTLQKILSYFKYPGRQVVNIVINKHEQLVRATTSLLAREPSNARLLPSTGCWEPQQLFPWPCCDSWKRATFMAVGPVNPCGLWQECLLRWAAITLLVITLVQHKANHVSLQKRKRNLWQKKQSCSSLHGNYLLTMVR